MATRRKLQKVFALLLAASMTMSLLSVGAFAADENGEETVKLSSVTLPEKYQDGVSVAYGTAVEDIELPQTLVGTVEQEEELPAEELQVPGEGEDVQNPGEGEDVQNPGEGEDVQNPGEGEDVQNPGEGEDVQNPGEGEDVQNPGEGEDVQNPGEGEDVQNPGEGEDVQNPGEGEDVQKPGEGEDGQKPGEGEDGQKPGEGEDGQKPGEGENGQASGETVQVLMNTKMEPAPETTVEVPVTWSCDSYDGWTEGTYTFTPVLGDGYSYDSELPVIMVTVGAQGNVARIVGGESYATLDEAIKAADEGATIEVLENCKINEGFNKTLTFTGPGNIRIDKQLKSNGEGWMCFGLYDPSRVLTFDGVEVEWISDGSSPWLMLSLSGTLVVTNGAKLTFKFDSRTTGARTAIYMNEGAALKVENGSTFEILGENTSTMERPGQGIQLDQTGKSTISVTGGSTFLIDGTNRGYVNSPVINVENSTFTVQNCTSNASNGGNFEAINSTVTYQNNRGHGLSAGDVILKNTEFLSDNNGLYGVYVTGKFLVDKTSTMTVTNNSYDGDCAGVNLTAGVTDGRVEAGAVVTITGNKCSGFSSRGVCTFEEGAKLTITDNYNDKGNTSYGGGIYNTKETAYLVLPHDAVICNNGAKTGGDDIYNTGTITFCGVGSDWKLDDCGDQIDGWYDDSADARWEAHEKPTHVQEFDEFEPLTGVAFVTGKTLALKAAHGVLPEEPESSDWDVSKSKTATNLEKQKDGTYTSEVTLSLPAAQETLESDVVFVLDKSTSAAVEDQMIEMLGNLSGQAEETGAAINVGVVIFNKGANRVLELTPLNSDNMGKIEAAIRYEISSGTNTHAGLMAGKAMLDEDTSVDANRKYLVFVSDGLTYMFDEPAQAINSQQAANGEYGVMAGNDCWGIRHYEEGGDKYVPDNWSSYLKDVGSHLDAVEEYIQPYSSMNSENHIPKGNTELPTTVDVALYKTWQVYTEMQSSGYHCYAMTAQSDAAKLYPWGPAFMEHLANGEEVSFTDIQNDIYYLLAAGSKVVDVIGYGEDNKGNDYNFDFVDDIGELTLTVGGKALDKTDLIDPQFTDPYVTSAYGFGATKDGYDFVLYYYADGQDGKSDECFVWEINVPVSNFAPVELTYTVQLTDPQTGSGTYGKFDADGSKGYDSLLTNLSATLYPVDSNEEEGAPEDFAKPTVSYTVKDSSGGGGGGDKDDGDDDDDDGTDIPDENTPTTDLPVDPGTNPEDPGTDLEDPDVPLAEVPETGDASAIWLALSALSGTGLAGVTFLGRKKKDQE